jgi:hypothetical protein
VSAITNRRGVYPLDLTLTKDKPVTQATNAPVNGAKQVQIVTKPAAKPVSKLQTLLREKLGLPADQPVTQDTLKALAADVAKRLNRDPDGLMAAINARMTEQLAEVQSGLALLDAAKAQVDAAVAKRDLMAAGVQARIAALLGE